MYYKDQHIEIRLGIGIKTFTSLSSNLYGLALSRIDSSSIEVPIATFDTDTPLTNNLEDGNYKLVVTHNSTSYVVYLTVNDKYIKEFITQIENTICNCGCKPTPCEEDFKDKTCIKRQRLFNLTSIMPYTIKPFSTGEQATNNPYLFKFFQLYYNEIIEEKKIDLGEEYINYYLKGSNLLNINLFKDIIALNYYALYYYAKLFLTTDLSGETKTSYINTINSFFNFTSNKKCLQANTITVDIEGLMEDVIEDPCFCTTNEPPPPPANIVADDVSYDIPSVLSTPNAIFDSDVFLGNLLELTLPFGITAEFITILDIIDVENIVMKGNNSINDILQVVDALPSNSIPLTIFKTVPQDEDYTYIPVLTCYVTDNLGRNSNNFTITFNLVHKAVPLVEELLVTIDNGTEAMSTVDFLNLIVYATIDSLGEGTELTSILWSIISYEFVFDGGQVFTPLYEVHPSIDGLSCSFARLTTGYRYTVQLETINNEGQECTFLMNLDVLG